jgi:hypothetical protein
MQYSLGDVIYSEKPVTECLAFGPCDVTISYHVCVLLGLFRPRIGTESVLSVSVSMTLCDGSRELPV